MLLPSSVVPLSIGMGRVTACALAEAGVTPAHALLFCQFFDEVTELWEDEFFHREADGVF
jgi:hypothetical protein